MLKLSHINRKIFRECNTGRKRYNPEGYSPWFYHVVKCIALDDDFTMIECRYRSQPMFKNGGWVNVHPDLKLVCDDLQEYKLVLAAGIPTGPQKHYFNEPGEVLDYYLFFDPIPKDTQVIDLIEDEDERMERIEGSEVSAPCNIYDLRIQEWGRLLHPLDLPKSNN